ncbi:hypothetical protein H2203_005167 [Taxawa tesnikishii (nom. ined.)]|nr:hypothetical protein H2203_005167 [Dothideales sp. JES 119]
MEDTTRPLTTDISTDITDGETAAPQIEDTPQLQFNHINEGYSTQNVTGATADDSEFEELLDVFQDVAYNPPTAEEEDDPYGDILQSSALEDERDSIGTGGSIAYGGKGDREDLEAWAPWRTHEETQQQISYQRMNPTDRDREDWVHDIDSFAFGHPWVNIHATMMVDILHQLLKGVLDHVRQWLIALLEDLLPKRHGKIYKAAIEEARQRGIRFRGKTLPKDFVADLIDRRFAAVSPYRGLRVFEQLSSRRQMTGKELKSILRQLLPVFTPFLEEAGATEAILFIRAVVDFVLLSLYHSHDDDTLRYMTLALFRMNQHKEIFRRYRPNTTEDTEGHFNFPKWHVMTHYTDMIRRLGSAPGLDTGHGEHNHVTFVKQGYKRTNRKEGWEDQLTMWNDRSLSMAAEFDIGPYLRNLTAAEKIEEADEPVRPTEAVNVERYFGWPPTARPKPHAAREKWRQVNEVQMLLGPTAGVVFRQALAVFVRESRSPEAGATQASIYDPDRLEEDDSWILPYWVQFHPSLRCRKATGKDPDDPDSTEHDIVRCAPNWQNINGNARHDWIWVQEYATVTSESCDDSANTISQVAFDGRLPARLQLIVTIEDRQRDKNGNMTTRRYTGALVDLYAPKNPHGRADAVHGMTVIKPMPLPPRRGLRRLGGRRIYPLTGIYHSIHVVSTSAPWNDKSGEMYINNTADWETYNFLWNADWEEEAARIAVDSRNARIRAAKVVTH